MFIEVSSFHSFIFFFFFNDTATTEIYTLSLHDALPIRPCSARRCSRRPRSQGTRRTGPCRRRASDRKSTRLNSSHRTISYAVFCLKKKKEITAPQGLHVTITAQSQKVAAALDHVTAIDIVF